MYIIYSKTPTNQLFSVFCQDDGPRVYPTAPQPVPVLFSLDGIMLERLDDGILCLRCESFGFGLRQLFRC